MKKYTFTQDSLVAIAKVLAWSTASALIVTLITIVEATEFPTHIAFLVPVINTALYATKEFISERR